MARRLADLSDRELAPLFNMTIPEVRRYRQSSDDWFTQLLREQMPEEALENERREDWLWNLSVEEFGALRESDDPNVENHTCGKFP